MLTQIIDLKDLDIEKITAPKLDLEKAIEKYSEKPTAFIDMVDLKYDGKPFHVSIDGEFQSEGVIINQEFGTHNIKMEIHDLAAKNLRQLITNFLDLPDYESKDFLDDENSLYLKLKYKRDKSKYSFKCNKAISPKNPSLTNFESGDSLTATGKISLYFNLSDKTCGLTFKMRDLFV